MEQCKKTVRHLGIKKAAITHASLIRLIGLQYRMMRCHLQNNFPDWMRVPFLFRGYNVFLGKHSTPFGQMDPYVMLQCRRMACRGREGARGGPMQCLCSKGRPCCCDAGCFCRCSCLKCLLLRYCIYERMASAEDIKKIVDATMDHEQLVEINVRNTKVTDKKTKRPKRIENLKQIKGDIEITVKQGWDARVEVAKKTKSEGDLPQDEIEGPSDTEKIST